MTTPFGGVLADDMGLGKTLQTLALIQHAKDRHDDSTGKMPPFLVVAPTSVVSNWLAETRRFAPDLKSLYLTETVKRGGVTIEQMVDDVDIIITSYGLFRIDQDEYRSAKFSGLILDEAQFVKNPATQAAKQARDFPPTSNWRLPAPPWKTTCPNSGRCSPLLLPGSSPRSSASTRHTGNPSRRTATMKHCPVCAAESAR